MSTNASGGGGAPLPSDAAHLINDLARRAAEPALILVPTAGLGDGLPAQVPALFNRVTQQIAAVAPLVEPHRLRPERAIGTAQATTLASFLALVLRHKTDHSVIFAETAWPKPSLTAVLDYHRLDHVPAYGKHRVHYAFPVTDELTAWLAGNGKGVEQPEFVRFLEDRAAELAAPTDGEKSEFERLFRERFATPAELITLARDLEVFVGAQVKQQYREASGERTMVFAAEHTSKSGEKVNIPGLFMVSVPAFRDGGPVRLPARLRYRVVGGSVTWSYLLYRPEFWLREKVVEDLAAAGRETGLPCFEGQPEMAG